MIDRPRPLGRPGAARRRAAAASRSSCSPTASRPRAVTAATRARPTARRASRRAVPAPRLPAALDRPDGQQRRQQRDHCRAAAGRGRRPGRRHLPGGGAHRRGLAALAADRPAGRRLGRPAAPPTGDGGLRPVPRRCSSSACRWPPHSTGSPSAHLLLVALSAGVARVFFETADQVYLPVLLRPEQLPEGNAKLHATQTASYVVGPGLAGLIAQLIGAVTALLLDAISFLVSAVCLLRIRTVEPRVRRVDQSRSLRRDIAEGLRFVARDPYLRVLTRLRRGQQHRADRLPGRPGGLPGPRVASRAGPGGRPDRRDERRRDHRGVARHHAGPALRHRTGAADRRRRSPARPLCSSRSPHPASGWPGQPSAAC